MPAAFRHLDRRGTVKISTGIAILDDPRGVHANRRVAELDKQLHAYWQDLAAGDQPGAILQYSAAIRRARSLGFDYQSSSAILERGLEEVLRRLEAFDTASSQRDLSDVEEASIAGAVLGTVKKPVARLSGLLDSFAALQAPTLKAMSEDQRRKWRNPKKRALANLLEVVGDKPIAEISRADALDFRDWWSKRVLAGEVDIATANKDFGHLAKMLNTFETAYRLGLEPVFNGMRIEGEVNRQRTAYRPSFVQGNILAEGALTGLNPEARRILALIADTGLRLSEACNLTSNTIHLNAPVPFIEVRPEGRKMKTPQSERDIPLVGAALAAMKLQPEGFPRYRDKSSRLSAVVNKVLDGRGLRPGGESIYSLRHTFEDRLTAVEAPEKLIAALMGHKYSRPRYGLGPSLEQKREWLAKIAFTPPADL